MSIYIYIYITKHTRNHIRNSAAPNTHPDDKRKMRTNKQKSQAQPGSETDRFIVYNQSKYCSFWPRVSGGTREAPGRGGHKGIRNHPRNSAPPWRKTKKTLNKLNIDALNDKTACDITPNSSPFSPCKFRFPICNLMTRTLHLHLQREFLILFFEVPKLELRNWAGGAADDIS